MFYQVITSPQSLLGLCEKQDRQIGHSIASTALALASLSIGSLTPERKKEKKGGHPGEQAGQRAYPSPIGPQQMTGLSHARCVLVPLLWLL